jgi:hypothetical protein
LACYSDITNLNALQGVSDIVNQKSDKKNVGGRPVTTGTGDPVLVRILPELMAGLDNWIAKQPGELSRPEAIRQLLSETLRRRGLL